MAKIKKHWLIIAIIVISAFFRLYRIGDYMEFLGDQGRDVVIVREFLKFGNLFFIGPQTSIGNMYLGPFYYYLFVAPGLLLTAFNPVGPSIIVAILGILTVYLIYKFSLNWFSPKVAYIASFLYAISPVVIKYSNFSWNPNVMPLFALLFIYFVVESRFVLASLAFIVCLNSHFLALILLPVAAIIYLSKKPKTLFPLVIPVFIFVVSLIPQILFDVKHQGQNFKAISNFFTQRETTVNLKAYKAIPQMGPLFVQLNTRLVAGKNVNAGLFISFIFLVLLIFNIYFQAKSKKINYYFVVLFLWLTIGLTGLALYKQHIYDHYFGFLFPVVFIMLAYLLSKLPKIVYIPILLVIVYYSLAENPFWWEPPKQLATTISIDKSIILESKGQPFNFALLAKMNYDPGYRYVFSEQNAPVFTLQDKITEQLFVVCEPFQMDCSPINNPEWSIAAFGWAKIDKQWDINGNKVFRLIHNPQGNK